MNKIIILILLGIFACYPLGNVYSDEVSDNQKMDHEAKNIDDEAREKGAKPVVERLETQFSVDDAHIQSLRDKKLGYGEIANVYALAKQMPGGITDANVQKIIDLRQNGAHKEGWGEIAKSLELNLGRAHSQVNKVTASTGNSKPEEPRMHGQTPMEHPQNFNRSPNVHGMGKH